MKKTIPLLGIMVFLAIGCEDKDVLKEPNPLDLGVNTFKSENVKVEPAQYFTFANNAAVNEEPTAWDVAFATVDYQPSPQAPTIKDPVILTGNSVSIAKVDATDLSSVTDVPAGTLFKVDSNGDYVTQGWYNYNSSDHSISPKDFVYVVKTSDGKYPAFEITNYYDDYGRSGVFTINWKYLVAD